METHQDTFLRSRLLLGRDFMQLLAQKRLIVFGIGGVGSWCVESLVRTGLSHITLVDFDRINHSNINSHSLKTIFQHKACTNKLYADSFYKVQKNSHSSFEVICCRR